MTLKLTPQNAAALFNMFNNIILPGKPVGLIEQLLHVHMITIYKKFRNQWEGPLKKTYKLKVTEAEALAYWIYWRETDMSQLVYELSFITNHVLQIDRELNTFQYNELTTTKLLNQ